MKQQPDKMTAYYYRAAHINTDLNLDNQMYRLLHHAMTNGVTAYALYVDNGFSGLSLDRPALTEMQKAMSQGRIGRIIVTDISRISRNTVYTLYTLSFSEYAAKYDIGIETIDGEDLRAMLDKSRKFQEALNLAWLFPKGGDCK